VQLQARSSDKRPVERGKARVDGKSEDRVEGEVEDEVEVEVVVAVEVQRTQRGRAATVTSRNSARPSPGLICLNCGLECLSVSEECRRGVGGVSIDTSVGRVEGVRGCPSVD
jgi:hypothetical protein